jgi:hypothetical protein
VAAVAGAAVKAAARSDARIVAVPSLRTRPHVRASRR